MARRRRNKDRIFDVNEHWVEQARIDKSKKATGAVSMIVKKADSAAVVLDPAEATLNIATLLLEHIAEETRQSPLPVSSATRDRRWHYAHPNDKADSSKIDARYPGKYQPDPYGGSYGVDSGYLLDSLVRNMKQVESGDRDRAKLLAGIPRNRQKAAFVLRGIKPNGALDRSSNEVLRKAIERWSRETISNDLARLKRKQAKLKRQRERALIRALMGKG
jgi:hypothetical protein